MPIEVEARFRADGPAPLERLRRLPELGPARLGPPRVVDETDRYLDTGDGAFADARWACRLRTREGRSIVSLKGPPEAGTGGWLHRRPEVEGPADESLDPTRWPSSPARDLVDRLRAGAPLVESVELRQRRGERAVEREGRRVGHLTLDEVEVRRRGTRLGSLWIVEFELAGENGEPELRPLAEALAAVDGLRPEPRSKLERALELAGIG